MAFLSWHERYSVGNPALDLEHRKCFELVNHFDDVIQMDMDSELGFILEDLVSCTLEHFTHEEALLEQSAYPGLPEHRRIHAELIAQLQEQRARMKAGGHVSNKSVVRFLADWLTNHILREDMAFKAHLKR